MRTLFSKLNVFHLLIRSYHPLLFTIPLLLCVACGEDKDYSRKQFLIVSETTEKTPAANVYCRIEGGKDTLFVFSNIDYKYFFKTNDKNADWVKIISSDYMPALDATRVILEVEPIGDNWEKRTGTLSFSSGENFLGQFIPFNQGFTSRLKEDFSWLKNGTTDPFDVSKEVLIKDWTSAQKEYGWSSSIAGDQEYAFCYGKNGYIRLGTENSGADLITPYTSNITKDTVLLVTFNAVAFTSIDGIKDKNKLTVNVLGGGTFADGTTSTQIDLGYYDYSDTNVASTMWNNSEHKLYIKSENLKSLSGDTRIQFVTGDDIESSEQNRFFIDNIHFFIIDWRSHYLINIE